MVANINEVKEKVLKKYFKDVYQLNAHDKFLATMNGEVMDLAEYHTLEHADSVVGDAIARNAWKALDQQAAVSPGVVHEAAHKVGTNPYGFFSTPTNEQGEAQKQETPAPKKIENK